MGDGERTKCREDTEKERWLPQGEQRGLHAQAAGGLGGQGRIHKG